MKKIATVIIAAGYSSRMHAFKPLLKFGDLTAVEKIIKSHMAAGIEEIILVAGHRGDEVADVVKGLPVTVVVNDNYDEGMYSSVKCGAGALSEDVEGFMLQPVDIPLVSQDTIRGLASAFTEIRAGILYPTYEGRRAHPPVISTRYKDTILTDPGEDGLRGVLRQFAEDAEHLAVDDPAVVMDMDNEAAYRALLEYDTSYPQG